jgi:hypothetical protein
VRSLQLSAANGTVEAKKINETDLVPFELLNEGKTEVAIAGYRKIRQQTPNNGRLPRIGSIVLGIHF